MDNAVGVVITDRVDPKVSQNIEAIAKSAVTAYDSVAELQKILSGIKDTGFSRISSSLEAASLSQEKLNTQTSKTTLEQEKLATQVTKTWQGYEQYKQTLQSTELVSIAIKNSTIGLSIEQEKLNEQRAVASRAVTESASAEQRLISVTNSAAASFNAATIAIINEDTALAKLNQSTLALQISQQKAREAGITPVVTASTAFQPQRDQLGASVADVQSRVLAKQQLAAYSLQNEGATLSEVRAEAQLTTVYAQAEASLQRLAQGEAAVAVSMSEATTAVIKQQQSLIGLNLAQVDLATSLSNASKVGVSPQLTSAADFQAQRDALESNITTIRAAIQARSDLATSNIQLGISTEEQINEEISLKNVFSQSVLVEQQVAQGEINLALARSQSSISATNAVLAEVRLNNARLDSELKQQRLTNAANTVAGSNRNLARSNEDVAHSFELTGTVARELFVIFRELGTGNLSLLTGSVVVLGNRMGFAKTAIELLLAPAKALSETFGLFTTVTRDAFGIPTVVEASTEALLGMTAALVAVGVAIGYTFYSHIQDVKDFNATMALTGNVADLTRSSFRDLAKDIASSTGESVSTAKVQLTAIINSGEILSSQYVKLGQAIASYAILAKVVGQTAEQVTQHIISSITGGSSQILKLNDEIHYLTEANQIYIGTHTADIYQSENRTRAITDLANHFDSLKTQVNSVKDSTFDLTGRFSDLVEKVSSGEWLSALVAWGRIVRSVGEKATGLQELPPPVQQNGTFIPPEQPALFGPNGFIPGLTDASLKNATEITPDAIRNQRILNEELQNTVEKRQAGTKAEIEFANVAKLSSKEDPLHLGQSFAASTKIADFLKQVEVIKQGVVAGNSPGNAPTEVQIQERLAEIRKDNPIRLDKETKAYITYAQAIAKINDELKIQKEDYLKLAPVRKEDLEIAKLQEKFAGQVKTTGGKAFKLTPEDEAKTREAIRTAAALKPITDELDKVYEKTVVVQQKLNAIPEVLASRIKLDPANAALYRQEATKLTEALKDQLSPEREASILLDQQSALLKLSGIELQIQTALYEHLNKARKDGTLGQKEELDLLNKRIAQIKETPIATARRGFEFEPKQEALDAQVEGLKQSGQTGDTLTVSLNKLTTAQENLNLEFSKKDGWEAWQIGAAQALRATQTTAQGIVEASRNFTSGMVNDFNSSLATALTTHQSFAKLFAQSFTSLVQSLIKQLLLLGEQSALASAGLSIPGGGGGSSSGIAGGFVSVVLGAFGLGGGGSGAISTPGNPQGAGYFGGISLPGKASGGYAGDFPVDQAAGVYHGGEFVMNASATARNRANLEAMNAGRPVSGSSGPKVTVHNYGSNVEVQSVSRDEVVIIARREASSAVTTQTPGLVASHISEANSPISQSLSAHINAPRKR